GAIQQESSRCGRFARHYAAWAHGPHWGWSPVASWDCAATFPERPLPSRDPTAAHAQSEPCPASLHRQPTTKPVQPPDPHLPAEQRLATGANRNDDAICLRVPQIHDGTYPPTPQWSALRRRPRRNVHTPPPDRRYQTARTGQRTR